MENQVTTQVEDQAVATMDNHPVDVEKAVTTKAIKHYETDSEKEDSEEEDWEEEYKKKEDKEEEEYHGPVFPFMKLPAEVRLMVYSQLGPDEGWEFTVKVYQDISELHIIPPQDEFRVLPASARVCREMRHGVLDLYCPVILSCEFVERKYCRMPGPDDAEFRPVHGYMHPTMDKLTVISDCESRWVDPPMNLEPSGEYPICLDNHTIIRVKSRDLYFYLEDWQIPGRKFNEDMYMIMAPAAGLLNEHGTLGEIPMEFDQETESDTDAYDDYDDNDDYDSDE